MTRHTRSNHPAHRTTRRCAPARVLLVDDAADFRTLLRITLAREDAFTVVGEADDGIDGLAAIEACRPDLVVTDLQMPRMDGLTFTAQVRGTHPDLPIVMVTGVPGPEIIDRAFEAGVSAFLEKRGGLGELAPTLRAALEPHGALAHRDG